MRPRVIETGDTIRLAPASGRAIRGLGTFAQDFLVANELASVAPCSGSAKPTFDTLFDFAMAGIDVVGAEPAPEELIEAAKSVCDDMCSVQAECLNHFIPLARDLVPGIYAGKTPKELKDIADARGIPAKIFPRIRGTKIAGRLPSA